MRLKALAKGDIVDIVAPASKCTRAELAAGVRAVRALGLIPRVPKGIFAPSVLFSNTDAIRLRQLRSALYAPDSRLIWCARGGYGSVRLVPEMQRWRPPVQPKILLGYSDITTLHSFLNSQWGWPTLHGPLLDRFGRGVMSATEQRQLLGLLFGEAEDVDFRLRPLNVAARRAGRLRTPAILGGNMAVLQSSLGTPLALKGRGRFLFFEDTGERPHRVDRMLTQFAQAGVFEGARAVIFGHFLLTDAHDRRQLWSDVIARFARESRVPVFAGLPVGHDLRRQMTLPLGTPAVLEKGWLRVPNPIF